MSRAWQRAPYTATFGAVCLYVDNWRWQGVPFYLRSGKLLPAKVTEITVQFKDVPHQLFPGTGSPAGAPRTAVPHANFLSLCIQPDEGVHLRIEAKMPGQGMRMRSVEMEFDFGDEFGKAALPDAYERLLLDALAGDASLFARADEIEQSWQIIDPVARRAGSRALRRWPANGRRSPRPARVLRAGHVGPAGRGPDAGPRRAALAARLPARETGTGEERR